MSKSPILDKSIDFAVSICTFSARIQKSSAGFVIAKQIVKSGTSIGANVTEAQDASSLADFTAKMSISLREAKETDYWLNILEKSQLTSKTEIESLRNKLFQIIALLTSIIKTSKSKR